MVGVRAGWKRERLPVSMEVPIQVHRLQKNAGLAIKYSGKKVLEFPVAQIIPRIPDSFGLEGTFKTTSFHLRTEQSRHRSCPNP